jgi:hypothetical protein
MGGERSVLEVVRVVGMVVMNSIMCYATLVVVGNMHNHNAVRFKGSRVEGIPS